MGMRPGFCRLRRKRPTPTQKSDSPPVRQRSANELSSGPSLRFMPPVLKRGGSSARRGEGVGSYFPPLQIGALVLHASVACNRARCDIVAIAGKAPPVRAGQVTEIGVLNVLLGHSPRI